jgi:hypothetical protein
MKLANFLWTQNNNVLNFGQSFKVRTGISHNDASLFNYLLAGSNDWMIMNNELQTMWKKVFMN